MVIVAIQERETGQGDARPVLDDAHALATSEGHVTFRIFIGI